MAGELVFTTNVKLDILNKTGGCKICLFCYFENIAKKSTQRCMNSYSKTDRIRIEGYVMKKTESLTAREIEVLQCVMRGMSNKEIAQELYISHHTAKSHVCAILRKLDATNKIQAAVCACKEGMLL